MTVALLRDIDIEAEVETLEIVELCSVDSRLKRLQDF